MGHAVIVAYRPHGGCEPQLRSLLAQHVPRLRALDLASQREALLLQAANGILVEVFEWKSAAAIEAAHQSPEVQALWEQFAAVCDYLPLDQLAEAKQLFAGFEVLS